VWDHRLLARFNWVRQEVHTWEPYVEETKFDTPVFGGKKSYETRAEHIAIVLQSLTPNHRGILALLARNQLKQTGAVKGVLLLCK